MEEFGNSMWHKCLGYCVLVSDGCVIKYFKLTDTRPRIKKVSEKLTLSAFKARAWYASKRNSSM